MARDDERQRVFAIGQTHRSRRGAITDGPGELTVTSRIAIGNTPKLLPDPPLKDRSPQAKRQVELRPSPLEVLPQLACGFPEDRMPTIFLHFIQFDPKRPIVGPEHRDETFVVRHQFEPADRRVHVCV